MKELFELLAVCRQHEIHFSLGTSGRELRVQGNVKMLTKEQISRLQLYKEEIIALLRPAGAPLAAVQPLPHQQHYELSSAQKRIWVLSRLGGGTAYHIPMINVFEGELQVAHLITAFGHLIEKHEILRTVFTEDETGEIRQSVLTAEALHFSVSCTDLRSGSHREAKAEKIIQEALQQPFDLEKGPVLRAGLIRLTNEKWIFHLVIHHIVCDGWSMNVLIRELMQSYARLCEGGNEWPAPLRFHYKDYAGWQQQQIKGEHYTAHRSYWMKQFEGELPVLQLPADKKRPAIKTYNGGVTTGMVDAGATAALKAMLQQQGSTLFMGLLTLVKIFLHRYTSDEDIIIGTPVAGREHPELEEQIGLYINTVAIRTSCTGADSFLQLLSKIKETTVQAQTHQAYPFDLLVDELQLHTDRSRNPLFDVMITLNEDGFAMVDEQPHAPNLRISPWNAGTGNVSKFDLSFNFIDHGDTITFDLVYNSDLYFAGTAERMKRHLVQLLMAVLNGPGMPVNSLLLLTRNEIQELLTGFNNTQASFPQHKTVVDLFIEQALKTPDRPALVSGDTTLTYRQLHEKTDQLAARLVTDYHVKPNELVGVMVDRSADMIVALLSVLKSGGAYVPIDPEYPAVRIEYILQDCKAAVLLTESKYVSQLAAYAGAVIALDKPVIMPAVTSEYEPAKVQSDDLAYVIYTSGSTGHPKGVMITHRSLVDYFFGIQQKTNIAACRRFGLVSTIAADLGNTVIYTSLLMGGELHIYSALDLLDAEKIFAQTPDCIKIVPSHWKSLQLPDKVFLPEKCLIFGGESLTTEILTTIKEANHACRVYNHYGPSETTIGKLINPIDLNQIPDPVPLGVPFCESSVYILDNQLQLVPVGIIGEICIAGAGVARGYFNRPELTTEKFVPDPFHEGRRMYKTGDLGRWLPNGQVEFIGRKDEQVKIRGYRVEPGEIALTIGKHPEIETAVVLTRNNATGEKELVAYCVVKEELAIADIRLWLGHTLPVWMIPTHFVWLDKLPLTPNGKIDKRSLPEPDAQLTSANTHIAPRNEIERQLVSIWAELLGKNNIGVKDDFFQSGGHSLKMMQLISRINRHFEIRINIQSIFKEPTVENISEQILFILDQNHRKANRKNLKQVEL
ncbi:hypothetical protein A4H97_31920 [Niastella yeongjuensis]|uniref:Carrier domain-containing protein n=1 Tax=Niastella yeongjuensis TaxID=354355 RepID=A0A1V9EI97_9BACT|nr:non-ribosomal peptide synthetase [Niastella yeongjuensis]OQP45853.1 hypothetical protein A4H97_31920 [Niastella yeongjuensis]SEP46639.1 amino acid adenylation domain-containing protein [Niastella yeongjuensis]